MHTIQVQHYFDAAHQLLDSKHLITKACARLHGHTYAVKVTFIGKNDKGGMVVDFKGIKQIIDVLDHQYINDIFDELEEWRGVPTTAENIAKFIHESIREEYPFLLGVTVAVDEGYKGENKTNWVTYG